MMQILQRIKSILNGKYLAERRQLYFKRLEIDSVKSSLRYLKTRIDIFQIERLEDVYSNVVTAANIDVLKKELNINDQNWKLLRLNFDDYIGVTMIFMKDGTQYLFATNYHPNFDDDSILIPVNEYPSFTIRKLILYKEGFVFPTLDLTQDKSPVKIDLNKI